jgi:peptidoglycan/xylan/chitin deacetylase (PgdA/CDA1 family)
VKSFPEAAKAIVRRGHEPGNHSLIHPAFWAIGADGALNEPAETERIAREITGASTRPYFRFPYDDSTPQMVETIDRPGRLQRLPLERR